MPENGNNKKEEDRETCPWCAHCQVCALFIGVQPLFMRWGDRPPVDPVNLFKICNRKLPLDVKQDGGPTGLVVPELTA